MSKDSSQEKEAVLGTATGESLLANSLKPSKSLNVTNTFEIHSNTSGRSSKPNAEESKNETSNSRPLTVEEKLPNPNATSLDVCIGESEKSEGNLTKSENTITTKCKEGTTKPNDTISYSDNISTVDAVKETDAASMENIENKDTVPVSPTKPAAKKHRASKVSFLHFS